MFILGLAFLPSLQVVPWEGGLSVVSGLQIGAPAAPDYRLVVGHGGFGGMTPLPPMFGIASNNYCNRTLGILIPK